MRTEIAFDSMHMRFRGVLCVWRALSAFTRSSAPNAQLKRMFGRVCPEEVLRGRPLGTENARFARNNILIMGWILE